jgi:predicted Zn-dependent protease
MLSKDQAQKLIEKALSYSTFPDCQVSVNSSEDAFIRYALNGITTSGFVVDQTMSVSSAKDGRSGSQQVAEFSDEAIQTAVKESERVALLAPPNPEYVEPLGPQKYPALDHFDGTTAAARNDAMIPHIRAVIEGAKAKNLVAAGYFERSASTMSFGNKAGNFGHGRLTDAGLSTTVRTPEGTSSGWASQPSVKIAEIDGNAIGQRAIEKCLTWREPKRFDPGKYTVVLEPTATGDLVQLLGFGFSARAAEQGQSIFSKKGGGTLLGEKMFPETITLHSDPFDARYPFIPWGGGGNMPSEAINWIENGEVKNLWYDRYWAKKSGKRPTPFPSSLILSGTGSSLPELIATVERGLLATRFWYIRVVNQQTGQLTGLTRDGLFLIENGKVTSPVVNLRFNESPVRLLQNVVKIGKSMRVVGGEGGGMIAPPLVVKDFPFTSVSDAV